MIISKSLINKGIKKISAMLREKELDNALECNPMPAFITLNMDNSRTYYVSRERKWDSYNDCYYAIVKILDDAFKVINSSEYVWDDMNGLAPIIEKLICLGRC